MAQSASDAVVRALGVALLATPANVASLLLYARAQLHRPGAVELLEVQPRDTTTGEPHVVPVLTPVALFREGVRRLFPGRLIGTRSNGSLFLCPAVRASMIPKEVALCGM